MRKQKPSSPTNCPESRQQLQHGIPSFYNPYLFFGLTNLLGAVAIYYSTRLLENMRPLEWLTIPAVFIFANFVEYNFHRGPMHNRKRLLDLVFKRHTLTHHEYFPHDQMGFDSGKEAYLVFFPFWVIFLLFGLASPVFFLTWYLTNSNVAGLFLITAIGYFLLYEWMHLLYHLPESNKLGRIPLIRALKRHHQTHHNHALMNDYNFNITFPIWDWVMGTAYRYELREETKVISPTAIK
ncbi:sterol desaturase family protein [bacterium]|nr:sterol desaturase family protein [bacterium]